MLAQPWLLSASRISWLEDQEVLRPQQVRVLYEFPAGLLEFRNDDLPVEPVLARRTRGRIDILAEVDDRNPPSRGESALEPAQIVQPVIDVVVGVHDEEKIRAAGGQTRRIRRAKLGTDVFQALLRNTALHVPDHVRFGIQSPDRPLIADDGREVFQEVARSGAKIRDSLTRLQAQLPDDLGRLLPKVAVGIVEYRSPMLHVPETMMRGRVVGSRRRFGLRSRGVIDRKANASGLRQC